MLKVGGVAAKAEFKDEAPCLTGGLPTPDSVAAQKEAYIESLERELREGVANLAEQHRRKTDDLHARANQQRSQFSLTLEKMAKEQETMLDRQHQSQLQQLQDSAQRQLNDLDRQAELLVQAWNAQEGHIVAAQSDSLAQESWKVPSGGSMRLAWPGTPQASHGGSMSVRVAPPSRSQLIAAGFPREQSMPIRSPSHATVMALSSPKHTQAVTMPASSGALQGQPIVLPAATPPTRWSPPGK
ncbi:unnamed protein product [Symbiodinium pilosum]|uniref:Uncharacterized protein n=1 Tax=Symbiodinium pilosum TaxID=2952 RepID=A0A812IU77_SYMPI|nr:unnamed protein product [Symbiodinium pilosum]